MQTEQCLRFVDPNQSHVRELLDSVGGTRFSEKELGPIKDALRNRRPVRLVAGTLLCDHKLHRLEALQGAS